MAMPLDVNGSKNVVVSSLHANNLEYDTWLKLTLNSNKKQGFEMENLHD